MSGHTPGPWRADSNEGRWHDIYARERAVAIGDTCERDGSIGPEEDRANALLMAAAPELAEALEAMLKCYGRIPAGTTDPSPIREARAALSRARGEA